MERSSCDPYLPGISQCLHDRRPYRGQPAEEMLVDQAPASDPQHTMSQQDRLAQAKRQVAAIKGFYIHLLVFTAVVLGLAIINAATRGPWWVQWVFLGWGIGVLAHALFVFVGGSRFVADWEDRKTRELIDKM
jgi:hypothetical protein